MNVCVGRPDFPPRRVVKTPKSYELVAALKTNPIGWWVNIHLDELPGNSIPSKKRFVSRSARNHFKPVQVHLEGLKVYVRRIPDPRTIPQAQPFFDQVFFKPATSAA
jgi:hypothetical protein